MTTDAQLSRLLFEARELIDMLGDIVTRRSGEQDDWPRRVRDEIDEVRREQGWSPDGYGGEDDADPEWWFLAICTKCGDGLHDPLPMPFDNDGERRAWVSGHMRGTGHPVMLMNQLRKESHA